MSKVYDVLACFHGALYNRSLVTGAFKIFSGNHLGLAGYAKIFQGPQTAKGR